MKQADVKVGGRYMARVSGALVPVVVLSSGEGRSGDLARRYGQRRVRFVCRNVKTGREVSKTAAALRRIGWVVTGDGGGHWED